LKKILIVDDSRFARLTMRKSLEILRYRVIGEAVDGLEGILKYKELNPDIILTDIEMPNLDGISMTKEIRNISENAKIIIISSIMNSHIICKAKEMNVAVVKKPLKESSLINAIKLLSK